MSMVESGALQARPVKRDHVVMLETNGLTLLDLELASSCKNRCRIWVSFVKSRVTYSIRAMVQMGSRFFNEMRVWR